MEEYKQQIINQGYQMVAETEDGVCFVNEAVNFSVILLKEYYSGHDTDAKAGHELHKILKDKYGFAEKSTICIIANVHPDEKRTLEKIQRDEYYFLKVFPEKISILPQTQNKNIKITFSPMTNENDKGNYFINPFEEFDGLCSGSFLEYLSTAKNGDVVKYPKIISTSFFNYWGSKLYKIEIEK